MIRVLSFIAVVGSSPAWAVGEHVAVSGPASEQLSQTICISMECVKGGDYTVSSKAVGGKMELKVTGPGGPRLSLSLPINDDGRLSNSDAMAATSQLVQAIEAPAGSKSAEKTGVKSAVKKKARFAKAHKLAKPVRVASRKVSRG